MVRPNVGTMADEDDGVQRPVPPEELADDDEGLSPAQTRTLLLASVGIALLVLLLIGGVTVASHVYGFGDGPEGAPDAEFSVVTVERDGQPAVNVTNEGPYAANPDEIVIEVEGERRGNWTELGGELGAGEIVAPGNSVVLEDVEEGDLVTVYWVRGDQREELGQSNVQSVG